MSKYINADEFTATIRKSTSPSGAEWIVAKVNEMPSADVVEVVRCEDCKYSHYNETNVRDESLYCCLHVIDFRVSRNDFCSDGERKESKVKKCFDIQIEVAKRLLEDMERKETDD